MKDNSETSLNAIPEEILDESISRLANGEHLQSILDSNKDYQQELASLLIVSQLGMNIPKVVPPTPYKRRLYEEAQVAPYKFLGLLQFMRMATIPIALLVALVGGNAVVKATSNALPGSPLYSLKRATEEAQLTFTSDKNKVATIHVELLQKRLDELKQASSTGNQEVETLALAELKTQTEKTFAEAAPIATANAISNQDSTLLNSLVAVNKAQFDVLTELSSNADTGEAQSVAKTALADSKKNEVTIAKIIATVNDQTLADLSNKITITGVVTYATPTRITVEKNTFVIDKETRITTSDGLTVADNTVLAGKITVTGTRIDDGTLIAKQIVILPKEDGEVKGTTDVIPANPKITPKPPTDVDPEDIETEQPKNSVSGSYISEPANSEYFE